MEETVDAVEGQPSGTPEPTAGSPAIRTAENPPRSAADSPAIRTAEKPPKSAAGSPAIRTAENPPKSRAGSPAIRTAENPPKSRAGSPVINAAENPPELTAGSPVINATENPPESTSGSPVINATEKPPELTAGSPVINATENPPELTAGSPVINATENPPELTAGSPVINATENPPESTSGSPVINATENPPELTAGSPVINAAENPPDDAAENPPDDAAENPPEEEEGVAVEAQPGITAATGDDSVTELPTALQELGQDEDSPFPEVSGVHYVADNEDARSDDMGDVLDADGRPPPMAPGPAIFYPDDASDVMDALGLGSEFIDEQMERKEPRRPEAPAPAVKTPDKPKRIPKVQPTYPYRAKARTDAQIDAAMRRVPVRHEYCGFIYSSASQRPQGGYTNYFLPIYRQPRPKQHVQIAGLSVPLDKLPINKELPTDLLPLSTIKVMWSSNRTRTVYKPESIYAYLTRFGPIDAVYPKSVNSAYVIFADLEAATAAIQCNDLGRPWDPLITFWAEPRMYNSGFYYKYATMENQPTRVRI